MQGRVIRGICLLTYLLSLCRAEELAVLKQVEKSEATDTTQLSLDENVRRSNDRNNFKVAPDALKDVNASLLELLDAVSKSSPENQNVLQTVADPSSGSFSNRSVSKPVPVNSGSHVITNSGLSGSSSQQGATSSGTVSNSSYSSIPTESVTVTLARSSIPNAQNFESNPKPVVDLSPNTTPAETLQEIKSLGSTGSSFSLNTNQTHRSAILYSPFIPNGAKITPSTTPQIETNFSPLFSKVYPERTQYDSFNPSLPLSRGLGTPDNSNFNKYMPLPQLLSSGSKSTFDELQRQLTKNKIQVRNADEAQYSESMNSYPFVSITSKSDSSSTESEELRSGAPDALSYPFNQNSDSSAQAYAQAQIITAHSQGLDPYSFGYPPGSDGQASPSAHASALNVQSSRPVIGDGKSRVIMPHEYVFPHKMRGGENVIQCTREHELHHLYTGFDCLVCICLKEYGLLEPVCASCSGCLNPAPPKPPVPVKSRPTESYIPLPAPDPYIPLPIPNLEPFTPSASAPSLIIEPAVELELALTTSIPGREVPVSCNPLPSGVPFSHPLSPCQLCICKEVINALGKIEVRIDCQDSPQCVVPPELTTLPPLPDIPVPMPLQLCEKFPPQVSFPHPKEKCKLCKCSVELSETGVPEQQITCFSDRDCAIIPRTDPKQLIVIPPAPPIPIPVEPYPAPLPEPVVEPVPEHFSPVSTPNALTPGEPLPWPPISTSPAPPLSVIPRRVPGPLPGPSPHESCRPYPPNQPFQHPWDDCQVCECTESKAVGMVNLEISCYTKLSCCIESTEQVISAIAEASSGSNSEENQAKGVLNVQSSTLKPIGYGVFNPVRQNQAYAEVNAIFQSASNDPSNLPTNPSAIAISNAVSSSQNQGYSEANAIAQNSLGSPLLAPGSYQTASAYGSAVSNSGLSSAEANAESLSNINNIPGSFGSDNSGIIQTQAYAEANAMAQKDPISPGYQVPELYQPIKPMARIPAVGLTSAETSEEYVPPSVTNKPLSAYPQYNPGAFQNQAYANANAQSNRPVSSTYQPFALYAQYNPEVPLNQAYAEAVAQYNELNDLTNTQKLPALYSQYNPGISGVNGQYVSSTFKPPTSYAQYSSDAYQNHNQAYGQANAQHNIITSTPRPIGLYSQYSNGLSQSQVLQTPNTAYTGAQNQAYAGANTQTTLSNPSYYLSGPYQGKPVSYANAIGIVGEQSSAIAKAVAQTQDYPPYIQPGSQIGSNTIANPSSAYTYPGNYYAGYMNPQLASYSGRVDQGLEGYKQTPVKYTGNYDFNGQAKDIRVLGQETGFYPYGAGYSQNILGSNIYSTLYPSQTGYDINPLYRPGQYGAANAQSSAQAFTNMKMQTKSGLQEDSDESK